jgi:hypothetical protein
VWPDNYIFRRTPLGDDEIISRKHGLAGDLLSLLMLINARRDLTMLRSMLPILNSSPALMIYLIDGGFVEEAQAQRPNSYVQDRPPPPVSTTARQAAPSSPFMMNGTDAGGFDEQVVSKPAAQVVPLDRFGTERLSIVAPVSSVAANRLLASFRTEISKDVAAVMRGDAGQILSRIGEVASEKEARALIPRLVELIGMYAGAREAQHISEKYGNWFRP